MIITSTKILPLTEEHLAEAELLTKLAFGTKLGIPDPANWQQGTSLKGRLLSEPTGAFAAFDGTEMVGAIFAIAWGSFGFFGPLVVHPRAWGRGIAQQLLEPVMDFFERNVQHRALYTFADSPLHIGLYQKFGFWPRFLIGVMKKELMPNDKRTTDGGFISRLFSKLTDIEKQQILNQASTLTGTIYDGLDVSKEITAVDRLAIGDTILLQRGGELFGFAVCHCGVGSEAEVGNSYIKFAAVRSGAEAPSIFTALLSATSEFALSQKAQTLQAGTSLARAEAFQTMRNFGFKVQTLGVAMHSPNDPAYDRPDAFVVDDWR